MRILLLFDAMYPDTLGGVERRNADLAAELTRLGHSVTLAGFGRGLEDPPPGVHTLSLGKLESRYGSTGRRSTFFALRFAWSVATLPLEDYDVVETANIPYIHILPLALRCALARKPLVVTWYEFWGPYWKKYLGASRAPVYRLVEWITSHLGDRAVSTSLLTHERLVKHRKRSAALVHCGVHVEDIRRAGASQAAEPSPFVFAGRLMREKQIDLLLRAVRAVSGEVPGVILTIFGDGPDRARLQALASDLGVEGRVRFRGHVPSADEVWSTLAGAVAAVQPSSREGFGLFPLEAMALGKPVIYCRSVDNAVAELVRDGIDGICTEPEPGQLAAAMRLLLNDPDTRERMGKTAFERAGEYDWAVAAKRFEHELLQVVRRAAV